MKKLRLLLISLALLPLWLTAQNLYLTRQSGQIVVPTHAQLVWDRTGTQIWVSHTPPAAGASLLAHNPWAGGQEVVLFNLGKAFAEIPAKEETPGHTIVSLPDVLIKSVENHELITLREQIPAPIVRLFPPSEIKHFASLPPVDTNLLVYEIVEKVDTTRIIESIARLQDFYTRKTFTDSAFAASEWLRQKFEDMGYPVELQSFTISGNPSSPNVIATKTGTVSSDKYVVIGAHYDSQSWTDYAPGADDNASGTAGVLEAARILAEYLTECTVIFCAFSGEEYGLFGSEAFASRCSQQGMNILGYFNMDMIAYRHPGDEIHTDMIYPQSAKPLADYYKAIAAIFVPSLGVYDGFLTRGGSDHTSFNNHGYMGIFPAEDDQHYSPYIHTAQDILGLSVNSAEMAMLFVRASLAGVSSLSKVYSKVGLNDQSSQAHVALIPNPAQEQVRIITGGFTKPVFVRIISSNGRMMMQRALPAGGLLPTQSLAPGVYMVVLSDGIKTATTRLLKR